MKKYVLNLILIAMWLVAGILVMCSEEVSKFSYAVLFICYIFTLIGDTIEDYFDGGRPPKLS